MTAEQAWTDLASTVGLTAYRAAWWLQTAPRGSPRLQAQMRPVSEDDSVRRIRRLIDGLDDEDFTVREKATQDLAALGAATVPALREAMAVSTSLEVRRRVTIILKQLSAQGMGADDLRNQRALEVLERIATAEARDLLRRLATGAPEARLTQEAKASLQRLVVREPR